MLRVNYDNQLNLLHEEITTMGKMVTDAINKSMDALVNKNSELAEEVIAGDKYVNSKENDIESLALKLLLQEQPVASDFRFVTSTLRMITDLERIGDQAADISFLNVKMSHRTYQKSDLGSLIEMGVMAEEMVETVVKAYVDGDADLAASVIEMDDKIDEYFNRVRKEVISDVKSDKFTTKNSLDILMIAKYLERIGDHAENLAEKIYYSITGEYK
ncbi:phosphate signaling complex protein PhoU [Helcococcus kunzii]|uniref:Phosphate-specific transport system accessory protein PhoU n=1 Tax=Helcococcus kunzii ATCC 51366 TaxID=883114 RepID=H3NLD9_9FIRM|nr:phosphate signaling complex protein PhoU [Helcococcus kunzii]EHR36020.1 phosphate transport system regulatory protein PhoU [Helcococcus kunzii ATCC 51366]MCT1796604.1 phosphate signaling complex protein PhoU [Helcococcus kunzii]MCT1988752.1 phosphate signaling complex protein PhoU [Helcococcus kunzii]QUY64064.1 phosphate signaling complex protein PhoU [Helcococcus kunzii]QZO76517.1 phosphate signaling complex protein PhoU [Helcococcus kunzii]